VIAGEEYFEGKFVKKNNDEEYFWIIWIKEHKARRERRPKGNLPRGKKFHHTVIKENIA